MKINMTDFFVQLWGNVTSFFGSLNIFTSMLDILLVAFTIYSLIKLVRDSRAEQLIKGILVLLLLLLVASLLDLKTLYYLLSTVFDNGLILLVVIFQPEIRRALERAGLSRIGSGFSLFGLNGQTDDDLAKAWRRAISSTCTAVETLQRQKMGALIVFERETKLGEIINSGTVVDADPTPELIGNIFFNKAPLHDGAVIMRNGRVYAAGCLLPLTDNQKISSDLGTRHRAAVGMSENSDAIVVVVSEETATVSIAQSGVLKRNFSSEALRVALENGILWDHARQSDEGDGKKTKKWRFGKKKS